MNQERKLTLFVRHSLVFEGERIFVNLLCVRIRRTHLSCCCTKTQCSNCGTESSDWIYISAEVSFSQCWAHTEQPIVRKDMKSAAVAVTLITCVLSHFDFPYVISGCQMQRVQAWKHNWNHWIIQIVWCWQLWYWQDSSCWLWPELFRRKVCSSRDIWLPWFGTNSVWSSGQLYCSSVLCTFLNILFREDFVQKHKADRSSPIQSTSAKETGPIMTKSMLTHENSTAKVQQHWLTNSSTSYQQGASLCGHL